MGIPQFHQKLSNRAPPSSPKIPAKDSDPIRLISVSSPITWNVIMANIRNPNTKFSEIQ